jgi:ubiquinone/menaquinone biosynthesis C-methylase UbiE
MSEKPHSAEQFTGSRNLWWHDDYLDLLARRLGMERCRSVLDLGAGVGHWTELVVARCAADAAVTAVDREPQWVEALNRRFAGRPDFAAVQADVADLSALRGTYDIVTCQTLLLHLPDVPAVLAQAMRLLSPGGLLLLAEPNNFSNRMAMSSVTTGLTAAQYGELAAFWWSFELGRRKLGLGEEWVAERLPKMIADAGFTEIKVFVNDRVWPCFPPYDTPEQVMIVGEKPDSDAASAYRAETQRCVLAGGLDAAACDSAWALIEELGRREDAARADGSLSYCGPGSHFVFAARKPV